ncbi:hypothetical protein GM3708_3502 [Geminocystis sp. NIES-3708]|uniref:hypothetical protein n=1 Tax=Geminocystis sp. NIES-3708 TaxID=1615909 RepID=UPI0005FCAB1E|nr:hypothetical protein [Geminocystis sp. NIES-3708]BAQ63096.1 hypothetical protein GM3708_3502 [Geminocystis sp. NIES-3708]
MNENLNYISQTIILIKYYGFELHGYNIKELIIKWTKIYPHYWIPLAVIEAIYQGRLKAISVEQILNIWLKKGVINLSFNYEFSRLINPEKSSSIEDYEELKDIFSNLYDHKKIEFNMMEESSVNNFQPLDDYSECFQKLKKFIIIEN